MRKISVTYGFTVHTQQEEETVSSINTVRNTQQKSDAYAQISAASLVADFAAFLDTD